ncbi:MAG: hypothetical protein J6033_01420 [Lachnospiraceae bacterium]|nr:hypothetical protein [Lachnospiraceae bacterium]
MAKNENVKESNEKTMTKYDLKMQRKAEEKAKAGKQKKTDTFFGILIVVLLVALVASFPIRNYLMVNGTYIKVADESVNKVEFDYNHSVVVNNYIASYGSYLSYFGLDVNSDFSTQMYSDTLTWGDYFDQLTAQSLVSVKALEKAAKEAGFEYNTDKDWDTFKTAAESAAKDNAQSVKAYVQSVFGEYATLSRVEEYVRNSAYINAYYDSIQDAYEATVTDDQIEEYYNENRNNYDKVDYYQAVFKAELPEEPTDLADEGAEVSEDGSYTPSEAEVAKAMEEAKAKADEFLEGLESGAASEEFALKDDATYSGTSSTIRDWLYDDARKEGDTTILEDAGLNQYYVLRFEEKTLDKGPTKSARFIILPAAAEGEEAVSGDAIIEEWRSGAATEESFAEIADKYNDTTLLTAEGGLVEAVTKGGTPEVVEEWLNDAARANGDVTSFVSDDGYTYVIYFVGDNKPEYYLSIRSTLVTNYMTEYTNGIEEGIEIEDPKGNLTYLKVEAAQEALDAVSEDVAAEDDAAVEESETETESETTAE